MIKAQIFAIDENGSFNMHDFLEIEFESLKAAFDYIQSPFWKTHAAKFVITEYFQK